MFGQAAYLGYTSKENSDSCTYAYRRCPKDPDVLLNYLNNHNGGFFRYLNGVNSNNFYGRKPPYLKFPAGRDIYLENSENRISFPSAQDGYSGEGKSSFLFQHTKGSVRDDDDERIPAVIYSDRTGTGELILDSSKFFD